MRAGQTTISVQQGRLQLEGHPSLQKNLRKQETKVLDLSNRIRKLGGTTTFYASLSTCVALIKPLHSTVLRTILTERDQKGLGTGDV